MQKKDIVFPLIIGELIAFFGIVILQNVGSAFDAILSKAGLQLSLLYAILIVFLPIGALLGTIIAYYLGKKILILWQAAKFVLVGILNTFVDLGVLNILMLATSISTGAFYSVFKGISFVFAVINSYFWNKFWTFKKATAAANPQKEFIQFLVVSLIGFGINVGVASLVVFLGGSLGMSPKLLANAGALAATLAAMAWNFVGYKFIVFK